MSGASCTPAPPAAVALYESHGVKDTALRGHGSGACGCPTQQHASRPAGHPDPPTRRTAVPLNPGASPGLGRWSQAAWAAAEPEIKPRRLLAAACGAPFLLPRGTRSAGEWKGGLHVCAWRPRPRPDCCFSPANADPWGGGWERRPPARRLARGGSSASGRRAPPF